MKIEDIAVYCNEIDEYYMFRMDFEGEMHAMMVVNGPHVDAVREGLTRMETPPDEVSIEKVTEVVAGFHDFGAKPVVFFKPLGMSQQEVAELLVWGQRRDG